MELTSITPTPQALRALSHPTRLRLLGLLRTDGPATATTLATRLRINTGQTSYHLRQLAQHGFVVEDTERGNNRDRWWRAAHQSTRTDEQDPAVAADPEALDAYLQSIAVVLTQKLQSAIEERPLLPVEWRAASTFSDYGIRLTAGRARTLVDKLDQLLMAIDEEPDDNTEAVDFVVQLTAFPRPGVVGVAEVLDAGDER
jgi:predicted ArsR family transcriptional regulator